MHPVHHSWPARTVAGSRRRLQSMSLHRISTGLGGVPCADFRPRCSTIDRMSNGTQRMSRPFPGKVGRCKLSLQSALLWHLCCHCLAAINLQTHKVRHVVHGLKEPMFVMPLDYQWLHSDLAACGGAQWQVNDNRTCKCVFYGMPRALASCIPHLAGWGFFFVFFGYFLVLVGGHFLNALKKQPAVSQSVGQPSVRSVNLSHRHPASQQAVSQSVSQVQPSQAAVSQSASQPASQPVSQSTGHSATEPASSQSVSQPASQPASQSVSQPVTPPRSQPVSQSVSQSVKGSPHHSAGQQAVSQSVSQPASQRGTPVSPAQLCFTLRGSRLKSYMYMYTAAGIFQCEQHCGCSEDLPSYRNSYQYDSEAYLRYMIL